MIFFFPRDSQRNRQNEEEENKTVGAIMQKDATQKSKKQKRTADR